MSTVIVKGHRRGKSIVKAYKRSVIGLQESVAVHGSGRAGMVLDLKKKYAAGFRALNRGGYDPRGFLFRTVRRAQGKKTSIYG